MMGIILYSALSSIVEPLLRLVQYCRPSRCFSQTDRPSTENQGNTNTRMLLIMFSIILAAGTGFAVAPSSASPAEWTIQ